MSKTMKSDARRKSAAHWQALGLAWTRYDSNEKALAQAKAERHRLLRDFLRHLISLCGDKPPHGFRKRLAAAIGCRADTAEDAVQAVQFAKAAGLLFSDDHHRVGQWLRERAPRRFPAGPPMPTPPLDQQTLDLAPIPTIRQMAEAWPAVRDDLPIATRLVAAARANRLPSVNQIKKAVRGERTGRANVRIDLGEYVAGPVAMAMLLQFLQSLRRRDGAEADDEDIVRLQALANHEIALSCAGTLRCMAAEPPKPPASQKGVVVGDESLAW